MYLLVNELKIDKTDSYVIVYFLAYLAEFLLNKGYDVHGIKRRTSLFNTDRIDHLYQDPHVNNKHFILHYGDLTDSTNLLQPSDCEPCGGQLRNPGIYRFNIRYFGFLGIYK